MKPYARIRRKNLPGNQNRIVVGTGDNQHWLPLILSALALLITPVVVAIISSNANQSGTNKDYVSLAVNILNSKDSTEENRKWALLVLKRLSPVPFSEKSEKQLAEGSGLTVGPIKFSPLYGPEHPLIKRGEKFTIPCPPVNGPNGKWSDKATRDYVSRIGEAYADCARKHQHALAAVDILQQTYKTGAAIESPLGKETYPVYRLK
jgi:hypothetical protein